MLLLASFSIWKHRALLLAVMLLCSGMSTVRGLGFLRQVVGQFSARKTIGKHISLPLPILCRQRYSTSLYCAKTREEDLDPVVRAKDVSVPMDKIEFSFARSSGPGGQNVNKLNTKAEMRFHVQSATWLAADVRTRLAVYQANKITKDGELYISSQEHRTQAKNKDDCIEKLKVMIAEAMLTPKEREMWVGLSERGKQTRREDKRKRGDIKNNRKKVKDFD